MGQIIHLLCKENLNLENNGLLWLIGSSLMPFVVVSILHCIHFQSNSGVPNYAAEAEDLRIVLPKGLEVVGAILIREMDGSDIVNKAGDYAVEMIRILLPNIQECLRVIAAKFVRGTLGVQYFLYTQHGSPSIEVPDDVVYEVKPLEYLWKNMCLMHSKMLLKVPLYSPSFKNSSDYEAVLSRAVNIILSDLRSPRLHCYIEGSTKHPEYNLPILLKPFVLGKVNDSSTIIGVGGSSPPSTLQCSEFCSFDILNSTVGAQVPTPVKVTLMLNQSVRNGQPAAPCAKFLPSPGDTALTVLRLSLDVLCMGPGKLYLNEAVQDLVIPALSEQLLALKSLVRNSAAEKPKICSYHFHPPGILHPISSIYDTSYGELELGLVEVRKMLHRRLGLPLNQPFLRIANSLDFTIKSDPTCHSTDNLRLCDVHIGLQSSGLIGGRPSLIQGSYEYYHYLQDSWDDKGWGCAYRSLQTIVSWFRLQNYTAVEVPSHRKIQEILVGIGDKEASFIGSQEWIGAIELSFVLDTLLGVTCKILNVRSGLELPEKCRELSFHFETQGTPVMIGGGVLAYTLLGVDYNESTGESSFLILDPHYIGPDDLKTIHSGGWCGWKKAVSNKGEFFLHNMFYNLLLPQRPTTV
eukprot:c26764_g1_i1 orf=595-2496(-)